MTEHEVYAQVLENLSTKTWGKSSFTWDDGSPKCIEGHLNYVIYGWARGLDAERPMSEALAAKQLKSAVDKRLRKLIPSYDTMIGYNDTRATYKDIRRIIEQAYHATKPVVTTPKIKRSWIDRLFNPLPASVEAHHFNLKE